MSKSIDSKDKSFPKAPVLILAAILVFNIFALTGCYNGKTSVRNEREIFDTLEDVEKYVQKTFFDENGNAKIDEYWKHDFEIDYPINKFPRNNRMQEPFRSNLENLEITGFTVSMVKGFRDGKKNYFLVEFEPIGHAFGKLHDNTSLVYFGYCSSPFKVFNIPEDNRYVFPSDGCIPPNEGSIIDGKLFTLEHVVMPYTVLKNDLNSICKLLICGKKYEDEQYVEKLSNGYTLSLRIQMILYGTIKTNPYYGEFASNLDYSQYMAQWE